jgi:hypothetical protein
MAIAIIQNRVHVAIMRRWSMSNTWMGTRGQTPDGDMALNV